MPPPVSGGPPGRKSISDPFWKAKIKRILWDLGVFWLTVMVVILCGMSYLFGSTYEQKSRVNNLKMLVVDFDGSAIGEAVTAAYGTLQADTFPTFDFKSATEYPNPQSVVQAVCQADYWGAVYTHSGASERLASAILDVEGNSSSYNSSDALTYVYNGARWPVVVTWLQADLSELTGTIRGEYYRTINSTVAISDALMNSTSPSIAVSAFVNPIQASTISFTPTTQGSANFYTTINMLMPQLAAVFIIIIMNMTMTMSGVFRMMRVRDVYLIRFCVGKSYSVVLSLIVTGYIWAFRETWDVDGVQFLKTWLLLLLFLDVNWQVFDSLFGSYLPMKWVSVFTLPWMLVNLASGIFPFEVMPAFYKIGYFFPVHHAYMVLVHIWSGCANQDYYAIPVLIAWWVVGTAVVPFANRKRCMDALKMGGPPAPPRPAGGPPVSAPAQDNESMIKLVDMKK